MEALDAIRERLRAAAAELRADPAERAEVLAHACSGWLDPRDPFRTAVVAALVRDGGFSRATAEAGLDATFRPWTRASWLRLTARSDALRPDRARSPEGDCANGGSAPAGVVAHVLAGALPSSNVLPLFLALAAGRPVLARAARHVPTLPCLALASVAGIHPELAALGAVVRWPRERTDLTRALLAGADVATVTGGDTAVTELRRMAPAGVTLIEHPHRVSVALVDATALSGSRRRSRAAAALARDVALHDQLGCLSPLGAVVVGARPADVRAFGEALARALADRECDWPRGTPDPARAAAIRAFHDRMALGAAMVWAGPELEWVVGVLPRPAPPPPAPLFRCAWLLPARDVPAALAALARWRGATAAVGFAGDLHARRQARELGRALGASRICPLGRMQSPPLNWRADGLEPLEALRAVA